MALTGIADSAFTGHGDRLLATLNEPSEVAHVQPDGSHSIALTAAHNALMLPAHFSGHSALEVVNTGSGFTIKQWGPLPRY